MKELQFDWRSRSFCMSCIIVLERKLNLRTWGTFTACGLANFLALSTTSPFVFLVPLDWLKSCTSSATLADFHPLVSCGLESIRVCPPKWKKCCWLLNYCSVSISDYFVIIFSCLLCFYFQLLCLIYVLSHLISLFQSPFVFFFVLIFFFCFQMLSLPTFFGYSLSARKFICNPCKDPGLPTCESHDAAMMVI